MASNKLSALSAVSGSLTSDSLVYIADTQDSGSSYSSKKITVANLLSDVATTTDLGTFTGTTIDNNQSIKAALQALETALETESANRATAISDLLMVLLPCLILLTSWLLQSMMTKTLLPQSLT